MPTSRKKWTPLGRKAIKASSFHGAYQQKALAPQGISQVDLQL
ncbi:hypothetical protein T11_13632 [Trichinella zimbabwensis]|uniref:Uncharacterized protein n=1 Tax=Trichinella zimbabwensis TaxID=268475 RepID=A0A0V1GFI1_9BILA|nr:hypothetical protein T11_13632 [Trichinella zimbabwensis]